MYEFYNPHPQNKNVGDCVKRALTKASGMTYQEVSKELNRIKRAQGASAYNVNSVWKAFLENLNAIYVSYPAEKGKPRMNGKRFCESHPTGTYILNMAGHLSCCVDGIIYDSWDCTEKCVYTSYQIPPKMVAMPGIEKLADLSAEYGKASQSKTETGEDILNLISEKTNLYIKKTNKGELWISLDVDSYPTALNELTKRKHLRCKSRRGSAKSTWYDEKTGMTMILKSGYGAYIWCTNNGK